jgi:hypothetical protein
MDGCEIRKSQRRRKNTRPKQSMATLQHIEAALLRIRRRFKEPANCYCLKTSARSTHSGKQPFYYRLPMA